MQHIKFAIYTALHSALTHLDSQNTQIRILFIYFSSVFNTIIPQKLTHKLDPLELNTSLSNLLLGFLTGRPMQYVLAVTHPAPLL